MLRVKNLSVSCLCASVLMAYAVPSSAQFGYSTALSACKAIVGSIDTAGSGGVVSGSASIVATGSGLNIVVCDLTSVNISAKRVSFSYFKARDNDRTVCNLASYNGLGNVVRSSSSTTSGRPLSVGRGSAQIEIPFVGAQPHVQFSCRLDQGDILHNFSLFNAL